MSNQFATFIFNSPSVLNSRRASFEIFEQNDNQQDNFFEQQFSPFNDNNSINNNEFFSNIQQSQLPVDIQSSNNNNNNAFIFQDNLFGNNQFIQKSEIDIANLFDLDNLNIGQNNNVANNNNNDDSKSVSQQYLLTKNGSQIIDEESSLSEVKKDQIQQQEQQQSQQSANQEQFFLSDNDQEEELKFDVQYEQRKAPFRIQPTKAIKKVQKNYNKNICRYLTRRTIRMFFHEKYESKVLSICNGDKKLYDEVTTYFFKNMEYISGFRVLKEYLIIFNDDSEQMKIYKRIFKSFLKWFLQERIIRYILKGEMDDKQSYIKYKNEVMLKYIDKPELWTSNANMKKKKKFN